MREILDLHIVRDRLNTDKIKQGNAHSVIENLHIIYYILWMRCSSLNSSIFVFYPLMFAIRWFFIRLPIKSRFSNSPLRPTDGIYTSMWLRMVRAIKRSPLKALAWTQPLSSQILHKWMAMFISSIVCSAYHSARWPINLHRIQCWSTFCYWILVRNKSSVQRYERLDCRGQHRNSAWNIHWVYSKSISMPSAEIPFAEMRNAILYSLLFWCRTTIFA